MYIRFDTDLWGLLPTPARELVLRSGNKTALQLSGLFQPRAPYLPPAKLNALEQRITKQLDAAAEQARQKKWHAPAAGAPSVADGDLPLISETLELEAEAALLAPVDEDSVATHPAPLTGALLHQSGCASASALCICECSAAPPALRR